MKETASFAMTEFKVTQWADKVGITKYGTVEGLLKELRDAYRKADKKEIRDAIGDCMVVLVMIGLLTDNDVRQCFFEAAEIVTKRTGHMTPEGIFVKDVK
jgi:NTP pyrophosphatase (non-canonical NTP hydrolase)